MTATDAGIRKIRPAPVAETGTGHAEPQGGSDVRADLREQIAGLLDRWRRLSARYGELGGREGSEGPAGIMSMGAVVYDTCAQDLAGMLADLDREFSGNGGADGLGRRREGVA